MRFRVLLVTAMMVGWPCGAFGADGWYLLIPRFDTADNRTDRLHRVTPLISEPLGRWTQFSAYDSAKICEAAKDDLANRYNLAAGEAFTKLQVAVNAKADSASRVELRQELQLLDAKADAAKAARCVASDDPRLVR